MINQLNVIWPLLPVDLYQSAIIGWDYPCSIRVRDNFRNWDYILPADTAEAVIFAKNHNFGLWLGMDGRGVALLHLTPASARRYAAQWETNGRELYLTALRRASRLRRGVLIPENARLLTRWSIADDVEMEVLEHEIDRRGTGSTSGIYPPEGHCAQTRQTSGR